MYGYQLSSGRIGPVTGDRTTRDFQHRSRAPFTCADFTGRLESAGVRISMEGRGRALDNVFAERQRRTLKQEEVYLHDDQTPREAMQELAGFLLR